MTEISALHLWRHYIQKTRHEKNPDIDIDILLKLLEDDKAIYFTKAPLGGFECNPTKEVNQVLIDSLLDTFMRRNIFSRWNYQRKARNYLNVWNRRS